MASDHFMVTADPATMAELDALRQRLEQAQPHNIGFPGATDFDYTILAEFFTRCLLNNVGDPYMDGAGHNHTKAMEREVISFCADVFRAPIGDRWGYVTSGGSEGNLSALQIARDLHPRAVVYFSDAAHPVDKAAHLLGLESVRIRADRWGEIDYDDLTKQLDRRRHRPVIVVASIGTTLTEAVDDVRRITSILDTLAIQQRFVHADAALSGLPLALLDPSKRPGFDLADGADSIAVSGHKFLGSPFPCGVMIVKASRRSHIGRTIGYTGTPNSTIGGSRSGHASLVLWYALRRHGLDGLRTRAESARELAAYTRQRLDELGWASHRHEHALTVALSTPPEQVRKKWVLATSNGWSHIITVPGVTVQHINAFIADLRAAILDVPLPEPSAPPARSNAQCVPSEGA